MKSGISWIGAAILAAWFRGPVVCEAEAQLSPALGQAWHYSLLPGSQLIDSCPVCDRLDIIQPMQGSFALKLVQVGPLFSTYTWETIAWTAGTAGGRSYRVTGRGDFRLGGEAALIQILFLEVQIDNGSTNTTCYLTNAPGTVERL